MNDEPITPEPGSPRQLPTRGHWDSHDVWIDDEGPEPGTPRQLATRGHWDSHDVWIDDEDEADQA